MPERLAAGRLSQASATLPQTPFSDVLAQAQRTQSALRFSAHAARRLRDRNIALSEADETALRESVDRAAAKGSRETLLLTENAAFVVSVANRTVITAVSRSEMADAVFTNIDSAVVVAPGPARS
ncbi:MAG TPA: TIGR02530 family flagellar biosynthesis protein [Candidatus Hydrogenedentes bacterium]|nr:TIGR02530 family flagellar biosynthesis protein [Candidatus Hydrogenedentota bacterium]